MVPALGCAQAGMTGVRPAPPTCGSIRLGLEDVAGQVFAGAGGEVQGQLGDVGLAIGARLEGQMHRGGDGIEADAAAGPLLGLAAFGIAFAGFEANDGSVDDASDERSGVATSSTSPLPARQAGMSTT